MKKYILLAICIGVFTGFTISAQEIAVIPGGILKDGTGAIVTGDYVRVRSGPTLEHRILTKVNKETQVTVLNRAEESSTISGSVNYWYKVKIEDGTEGWLWGEFLREKHEEPAVEIPSPAPKGIEAMPPQKEHRPFGPELPGFSEIGRIPGGRSILATGDLNGNGEPEILLFSREQKTGPWNLTGYEAAKDGKEKTSFTKAYTSKLKSAEIRSVQVYESNDARIVIVNGSIFSYLYTIDTEKSLARLMYKVDSPYAGIGSLDGKGSHLFYARKSKALENDGTVVYTVHAAPIVIRGTRVSLKERLVYDKPLPVKDLLPFDLDGDGRDEIVLEIGGGESGGGIVILESGESSLIKAVNSGIPTYKDNRFTRMWGLDVKGKPKLFIYTTDPDMGNDAGTSFGILMASMRKEDLIVEKFYPMNRMLDDVSNNRTALLYVRGNGFPFALADFDIDAAEYTIKRPVIQ